MTPSVPFVYVPIIAVCCYAFLLLTFLAAKKNRVIYSFMLILGAFMLWTGGAVCMRLLTPPVYFWYEVSLLSLFTTPTLLYLFICDFIEVKGFILKIIYSVLTVVILILTHFEVFLKRPELVILENGAKAVFVYHTDWRLVIPCTFFFIVLVSIAVIVVKQVKIKGVPSEWLNPILMGMGVLFVGNVMSVIPNNTFQWDTLSGIFLAFFLFYALYKKRLFKLTLIVSRGSIFIISAAGATVLFSYLVKPIEEWLKANFERSGDFTTIITGILFSAVIIVFYKVIQAVVNNMFIKEEQLKAQQLKEFSLKISKSLNLEEILSELITVVKSAIDVDKAYIFMRDEASGSNRVVCTASPLDSRNIALAMTNPCVQWFDENDSCLIFREFKKSTFYKSMWEAEKRQLEELNVGCLVPLKCDNELVGILMLSEKHKNASFTFDDVTFLDSIQSISSIAIKNAKLYKNAYNESRIDHLTGILNRKYFYEKINEEFERCKDQSLALVILNIDDFKLYNQLYGNREGDIALQNIARIITTCVGSSGIAARYSGKEFAIILPKSDTMQAFNLASEIKQQIADMNKTATAGTMKMITLSGGVCVYPYSASNVNQLMENADMAVYNAKRSGKNKILVYSMEKPEVSSVKKTNKIAAGKYSEYASTIYALTAAIDAKDHYTFSHSQKVAEYSTALAKAIGLNEDHVQIIYEAALLHDIGKISIPENILSKPGRLTDDEFRIMQSHVENSISIIRHLPSLDYVIPAAIAHHERWDGRGYPRGLKGEDIPISARCLAIADAFDAMTAERPYKKPLSVEFAMNEINNQAGMQFDPHLADIFVGLVREGKLRV